MRLSLSASLAVLAASTAASAQTVTDLTNARTLPLGTHVEVSGILVNTVDMTNSGTVKTIHMDDGGAGVAIFGGNALIDAITAGGVLGDEVTIRGTTGSFNGLFQIQDSGGGPLTFVSNDGSPGVPAALPITLANLQDGAPLAEALESRLCKLSNVFFTSIGSFTFNANYNISDGSLSGIVRIATADVGITGTIPTGSLVEITGIVTQFDTSDPRNGGYQIQPRSAADLVVVSPPGGPVPKLARKNAPFNGTTCSVTVEATDTTTNGGGQFSDNLTFTITTNPGSGGGTLSPTSIVVPGPVGTATRSAVFTYTIPPGFRGVDSFTFTVDDGTTTLPGNISVSVRGDASQNTVAYGANGPSDSNTLKLYTGSSVPYGGSTSEGAVRDEIAGQAFMQSVEFDNYNGRRHNPDGNLLILDFGPGPAGPGRLLVAATQANCADPGPTVLYVFDKAVNPALNEQTARVTNLAVSPDNLRLAVLGRTFDAMAGVSTPRLYIFDYTTGGSVGLGGAGAASVTLANQIDLSGIMFVQTGLGVTWEDNDNILILDSDGGCHRVDRTTLVGPGLGGEIATNPRGLTNNISASDIEYNPELSPYVYVTIGEFGAGVSINTLYVFDPALPNGANIVQQSGGANWTDYSFSASTFRESAFDCYGNLFIGGFVDFDDGLNTRYIRNAIDVAGITGGADSLYPWRVIDGGEFASNFSGLDVACNTIVGGGGTCPDAPPAAFSGDYGEVEVKLNGSPCLFGLQSENAPTSQNRTYTILNGGIGSAGGTLTKVGTPQPLGDFYLKSQHVEYTPLPGYRGSETFQFRVTDGAGQNSNTAVALFHTRDDCHTDIVAYGGNSAFEDGAMLLYKGKHIPGGGTAGAQEAAIGLTFSQSTEFDNRNGVPHNPIGNLLALDFGTTAGGGALGVYATNVSCSSMRGTVIWRWDGLGSGISGTLSRVTGLSVSPSNNRVACYGYDTQRILLLDYTIGPNVGLGGPNAADLFNLPDIDVSTVIPPGTNRTIGTAWLNNNVLMFTDHLGNLYSVDVTVGAGSIALLRASPRTVTVLQSSDVEYNAAISPYVYVSLGEFSGTSHSALYIVDPGAGFAVVNQSGGATHTLHDNSANTFREIALDSQGNLFMSVFNSGTSPTNIEYIPNADTPASITADATIDWNALGVGEDTEANNGLDVALGNVAPTCALPGDMNGDATVDGDDIQEYVNCIVMFGPLPAPVPFLGPCVDMDGDTDVDTVDVTQFVNALLN